MTVSWSRHYNWKRSQMSAPLGADVSAQMWVDLGNLVSNLSQGTVVLHSVTKSLQSWVLGAEYKVYKVYDVSSQEGDGKAVKGRQVPAKIEDGYDPPRSHWNWKIRDLSQYLSFGWGIARHLGITSKGNIHCLGALSPLKGEEVVGMVVTHAISLLICNSTRALNWNHGQISNVVYDK